MQDTCADAAEIPVLMDKLISMLFHVMNMKIVMNVSYSPACHKELANIL